MSQNLDESQNVMFVFTREKGELDSEFRFERQADPGRFWIYAGGQYHRFVWRGDGIWFVRSQAYLPKYMVGNCVSMDPDQRQELEWEAARYAIEIPFFDSMEACSEHNLLVTHDQLIYDQSLPAGFFFIGKGMKRSQESGEESD